MYTEFYNFNALPFQLTPDGSFFFGSAVHNRAMGFLNYGIIHGEGYVVVTGEVGSGKTTLVEHLLANLDPAKYLIGRIVTTQLDGDNMLRMVGMAFGVYQIGLDKAALFMRIRDLLVGLQSAGRRALLIVDEAQSLPKEALEELRMLSNITVSGGAPIQGILLGQPEFRGIMASAELEQLRQRVIASCHLGALDADDTRKYIEHRLTHVGWNGVNPLFSEGAFAEIYRFTSGIPRRINTLCSRILLLGFIDEKRQFTGAMVAGVAKELAGEVGPLQTESSEPTDDHRMMQGDVMGEIEGLEKALVKRIDTIEQRLDQHDKLLHRELSGSNAPQPISKFR